MTEDQRNGARIYGKALQDILEAVGGFPKDVVIELVSRSSGQIITFFSPSKTARDLILDDQNQNPHSSFHWRIRQEPNPGE